ncbi:MAG: hypothetical protein AUG53_14435 [Delftia sp. 13_1_20CM_4_67_18]|nr:MAG: hypothetical protein AUG53_14435 [Delftia sp. 13_1_20CM_4_67_18]
MHMPMMNVRVVRMPVSQHLVRMGMDMRFFAAPFSAMAMLMVLIMSVAVRMHDRLMRVLMLMTLSQVKPNADAHEHCRRPEQRGGRFLQNGERQCHTEQRCDGEVRAGTSGAKGSESDNEESQAESIAQEPHSHA